MRGRSDGVIALIVAGDGVRWQAEILSRAACSGGRITGNVEPLLRTTDARRGPAAPPAHPLTASTSCSADLPTESHPNIAAEIRHADRHTSPEARQGRSARPWAVAVHCADW